MNFISFIKRPLGLVANDKSATTTESDGPPDANNESNCTSTTILEAAQKMSASPSRTTPSPPPLRALTPSPPPMRAMTPLRERTPPCNIFMSAMNRSIGLVDAITLTPTVMGTLLSCSNLSAPGTPTGDGSLNASSGTIEELLIQINDNLDQAEGGVSTSTCNDGELPAGRPLSPPPVNLSMILAEPGNVGKVLTPSKMPQTANNPAASVTQIIANGAASPAIVIDAGPQMLPKDAVSEAGLSLPYTSSDCDRSSSPEETLVKLSGLPEFDEASMHSLNLDSLSDIQRFQLYMNNEPDTAVSSESELFVECQSYREENMNNTDDLPDDHSADPSELDTYRSAVNISASELLDDQLNATLEQIPGLQDEVMDLPNALERRQSFSIHSELEMQQPQQQDMLLAANQADEPMDVDVSYSQQSAELAEFEAHEVKFTNDETLPDNSSLPQYESRIAAVATSAQSGIESTADAVAEPLAIVIPVTAAGEPPAATPPQPSVALQMNECVTSPATHDAAEVRPTKQSPPTQAAGRATSASPEMQKSQSDGIVRSPVGVVNSPCRSSKSSSTSNSPTFPLKSCSDGAQFPHSPVKPGSERKMSFLEKSDYAERLHRQMVAAATVEINLIPPTPENANKKVRKISISPVDSPVSVATPPAYDRTFDGPPEASPIDTEIEPDRRGTFNVENRRTFNMTPSSGLMNQTLDGPATTADDDVHTPIAVDSPIVVDLTNAVDSPLESTMAAVSLNRSPEERRRTFSMSPTRTLNNSQDAPAVAAVAEDDAATTATIEHIADVANISCEAMDIDEVAVGYAAAPASPSTSTHHDDRPTEAAHELPSPSHKAVYGSSPPIPMQDQVQRQTPEERPPPPLSPPLPTMQRNRKPQMLSEYPPGVCSPKQQQLNNRIEDDLFKAPLPPPPRSPIVPPIVQKRRAIHKSYVERLSLNGGIGTSSANETLSAKERIKCDALDEKDIAGEQVHGTPSPLETMFASSAAASVFKGFDSENPGADQFTDADFQVNKDIFYNPSDFDYLLTKGTASSVQHVDRSSLLLKFDPLLGLPVAVNQQPLLQQQQHIQAILAPFVRANAGNINTTSLTPHAEEEDGQPPESAKTSAEQQQPETPAPRTKKNASMSVDVIDTNDCNKPFETANSQADEKQNNYKMDDLEKKIKNEVLKTGDIEKKLKDAEQREEQLIKRITEKDKTISKMNGVIEAYEKTIAELIAEKEQIIQNYEKQLADVKADRDSNYHHLTSLETTFSDLHIKYEKSKEMTQQLKSSEEALLVEKRQILENLHLQEQRYDKMKNHAMQQLEIANRKLETLTKEHAIESTKLKALLKKEEISRASINEQLQQKSRENAELMKICDELINGQGS